MIRKSVKAAIIGVALLMSTTAMAHETHYVSNSGVLTATYRCYHLSVAAGNSRDAEALLRLGDYEANRRGLSAAHTGEFKGYSRRMSEEDAKTHGSPAAAFTALGCSATARSRIVDERPGQRIPPPLSMEYEELR